MTHLDELLTDTFEDLAAQAPHDPDLAARVRARARRGRLAQGAALAGLAAATAAVVAVVGFRVDPAGTPPAAPAPAACRSTVVTGVLPVWARGGFSDARPVMPYVTSASGGVVAIIWSPSPDPRRTAAATRSSGPGGRR